MDIGKRLKDIRTQKQLSQGDIQNRTGLFRCYTSRVENGHTVPSIETLEKMARALEVPLYQFFIGADETPNLHQAGKGQPHASRKQERQMFRFANFLANMKERDQTLLLKVCSALAGRKK